MAGTAATEGKGAVAVQAPRPVLPTLARRATYVRSDKVSALRATLEQTTRERDAARECLAESTADVSRLRAHLAEADVEIERLHQLFGEAELPLPPTVPTFAKDTVRPAKSDESADCAA